MVFILLYTELQKEVEEIKGYIRGSIQDMQSLLADVSNNTP